jgi:hypothetical protein
MICEKASSQGIADAMKGYLCEIKPSFSLKKITLMARYVFSALNCKDIFFQPDVIAIVQKYYLQNKCSDFKRSDLSFTTKTLDFTVLSKQLLPYLSNDTLEPILNTLFCYSYLSFICSKPFTLEYQPLHTYCTQNPLLSFQCILEFSNTEQIRHDPETPPEEITPLAEKITSIHHKLIYDI